MSHTHTPTIQTVMDAIRDIDDKYIRETFNEVMDTVIHNIPVECLPSVIRKIQDILKEKQIDITENDDIENRSMSYHPVDELDGMDGGELSSFTSLMSSTRFGYKKPTKTVTRLKLT